MLYSRVPGSPAGADPLHPIRSCLPVCAHCTGHRAQTRLLSDTEFTEDAAQQIIGTEFPRNLCQGLLGQPQVLARKLQVRRLPQALQRGLDMCLGALQGLPVTSACQKRRAALFPAQQAVPDQLDQALQARTRLDGQPNLCSIKRSGLLV